MQNVELFKFWCQKVLPLVYDDSISYYETLCKLVSYINGIVGDLKSIAEIEAQLRQEIANVESSLNTKITNVDAVINNRIDNVVEGLSKEIADNNTTLTGYITTLQEEMKVVQKWIDDFDTSYAEKIIEDTLATMIFLEISDDGYIMYYIPTEWEHITFNTTGLDIVLRDYPEYGRLVLTY